MSKPLNIAQVEALTLKLTREGVIAPAGRRRGEFVQFQVRHEVLCGVVVSILPGSDDRRPSFCIETDIGRFFPAVDKVRACEGMGPAKPGGHGCVCAQDATRAGAGRACAAGAGPGRGRSVSPLGNTGITAVQGRTA